MNGSAMEASMSTRSLERDAAARPLTTVADESWTMLSSGLATARTNAGSVISALPFTL
jgi:hypothetical protein